jgi:hypothetical protein
MKKGAIVAAITLGLLLTACASASSASPDRLALPDLEGVESLQDLFNSSEEGTTRLILILSPT